MHPGNKVLPGSNSSAPSDPLPGLLFQRALAEILSSAVTVNLNLLLESLEFLRASDSRTEVSDSGSSDREVILPSCPGVSRELQFSWLCRGP
jgi:hypothetical protein